MSKASKAPRPSTAKGKGKAAPAVPRRINARALVILGGVVALAVIVLVGLRLLQGIKGTDAYYVEAKKAEAEGRPDMAISFVNVHLEIAPDDLEALELKSQILAKGARDAAAIEEAIRVQRQILALDPSRLEARKRLVELSLRAGLYRAAEAAAEEYLSRRPDDPEAHRLMARAEEGVAFLGDAQALDKAIENYKFAEEKQPGDILGAVRLAMLYRDRVRNPEGAAAVLDRMVSLNPKSAAARLARFQFFLGEPGSSGIAKAEAELDEALKLGPKDAEARIASAEYHARRGDTARSRRDLAAIDPPPKNDLRVQLLKGLIELQEQHPEDAIQSWRAGLVQTGGTDAQLTWRLALVLIRMGRLNEAKPLMNQYRRLVGGGDPKVDDDAADKPEYRYLVALALLRQGRPREAIEKLEAIRDKIGRDFASQHMITLGDAYEAVRDEARAIDCYRRALPLPGSGVQPWLAMARVQVNSQPAEAVSTLERALATAPDDPAILTLLSQILWQQEAAKPKAARDWSDFLKRLAQAEKAAPASIEVAAIRADYLAATGQLEDALTLVRQATERTPQSIALWLARAQALTRLRRFDQALAVLDDATKAAGDNASFRAAKARVYLELDEPKRAYAALVEGLDAVPADQRPQLWRAIGEYQRGRADLPAARKAFEEWARLQPDSAEPRLALFNLEASAGDIAAMDAQVEALRKIAGPASISWKVARAEALIQPRPGGAGGRDPGREARLAEAEALIAEIKETFPRQPSPYLLEARLMELRDRPDDAIAAYRTALDYPGGTAALRPLVVLLSRQHRTDEIEQLKQKVGQFPAELQRLAGAMVLEQGDADRAEEMARKFAQGNPGDVDAAVWQARVLNTLGKPGEAEDVLKVMAQQRPEDPAPWVQLLIFQVARRELPAARATLEAMRGRVKSDRPELLWANCYRILGSAEFADEQYREALRKWPDDVRVLQAAIDYEEVNGRGDAAERHLRHLLEVRRDFEWARRRLALNLSSRPNDPGAWAEAMRLVAEVTDKSSETPDDRLLRAIVLSRSIEPRNREQAIAILEELSSELPNSVKLHEVLARSYAAAGDRVKARDHAARATSASTEAGAPPAELLLFNAGLALADNDLADAERQLDKLLLLDPKSLATAELNARILHAKKDDAAAAKGLRDAFEARRATPGALAAGTGLLKVMTSLGLDQAAAGLAKELATLGPKGRLIYGEYLNSHGRADEARAEIAAAYKGGGGAEAIRASLALAGNSRGPDDDWVVQTDGLLRLALKDNPGSLELIQAQAYLLHLQGKYEDEVKAYQAIIDKKPDGYLYLNNMAWTISEELNRPADALAKINAAIEKTGRQPHLMDTRGVILTRLGKLPEAISDLEAAVAALPSPSIYYHLARACKKAGREADFEKYRDLALKRGLKAEQLQPSEREEASRLVGLGRPEPAAPPTST